MMPRPVELDELLNPGEKVLVTHEKDALSGKLHEAEVVREDVDKQGNVKVVVTDGSEEWEVAGECVPPVTPSCNGSPRSSSSRWI